jgi:heme exporter protein D
MWTALRELFVGVPAWQRVWLAIAVGALLVAASCVSTAVDRRAAAAWPRRARETRITNRADNSCLRLI